MKRFLCLLTAIVMMLSLCACNDGGKYRVLKTIGEQEYSIGFRNGDTVYHYIDAAIRELNKNGTVGNLAAAWLGSASAVHLPSGGNKLKELGYIAPRTFIIGANPDSYPMCIQNGDEYTGFDIELAKAACKLLGWELRVQPIHSEDTYVELNSGNIDCAWGGVVLDTESADYTILSTYMSTDLVIAGLTANGGSIKNKSLYMGTSQYYMDIIEENPSVVRRFGQITRVQGNATDYFNYLNNGECEAIIITDAAVKYGNTH